MSEVLSKHRVPSNIERTRIYDYAINIFPQIQSRKALKKSLKKGIILINNKQAYSGDYLIGDEVITLITTTSDESFVLEKKIHILYEDDHLAVVTKPSGLATSGQRKYTLQNTLPYNLNKSPLADGVSRPHVIHRLDFATSGVVLIGKTASAIIDLNKQFEVKQINKVYYAIALGKMNALYDIKAPILNKPSQTKLTVMDTLISDKYDHINLIKANPITGRTHQIRKHMAFIGHPICGDNIYNNSKTDIKGNGLYLHAQAICFTHPESKEDICVESQLPKKFTRLFNCVNFPINTES